MARDRRRWFDLAASLLGLLVLAGVYLDGWAHNHDKVDQSFFTPWHAVLYFSIFLAGVFFAATAVRNRLLGVPRLQALPPGYLLSFGGVALFMAGGLADIAWHLRFGIEEDTEALLSPTHLLLAFSAVLIVSGPWRSALRAFGAGMRLGWLASVPLLLSLASVIALLAFMTQFSHPLTDTLATKEERRPPALPDVYVMNADGSGQTRLTLDPDLRDALSAWSPDGQRLVIVSGKPPAPSDLYLLNADGTGLTRSTPMGATSGA